MKVETLSKEILGSLFFGFVKESISHDIWLLNGNEIEVEA